MRVKGKYLYIDLHNVHYNNTHKVGEVHFDRLHNGWRFHPVKGQTLDAEDLIDIGKMMSKLR
jgi:hypothetical protein